MGMEMTRCRKLMSDSPLSDVEEMPSYPRPEALMVEIHDQFTAAKIGNTVDLSKQEDLQMFVDSILGQIQWLRANTYPKTG
jgi:hypothetical protein